MNKNMLLKTATNKTGSKCARVTQKLTAGPN